MNYKEALDVVFKLIDSVNYYWQVLVGINVVVIGWLLTLKKNLTLGQKIIGSISYLLLVGTNLRTLLDAYQVLYAAAEALRSMPCPSPGQAFAQFCAAMRERHYEYRQLATWLIHFVGVSLILVLIWSDRLWNRIRAVRHAS